MPLPDFSHTPPTCPPASADLTDALLRHAKRLHRAATSSSVVASLPVLRRLLNSGAIAGLTLTQLYRQRSRVQRKHVLRTLALEAGFPSWEALRATPDIDRLSALSRQLTLGDDVGHLKLWFTSETEARAFAAQHGGQPLCFGQQAVMLPATIGAAQVTHG